MTWHKSQLSWLLQPMKPPAVTYAHRASLVRMIDGDSGWFCVDFGLYAGIKLNPVLYLRLEGIDCYERAHPKGAEARMAAIRHLMSGLPVVVQTIKPDPNPLLTPLGATFARTRAHIWVGEDNLADLLRAEGFSKDVPRII